MNHFTIVIPSYNNIKWIEKCIDSAINQKYKNFDVIYIDAESNDGSYELVCDKYKDKIKIIRNDKRKYQIENILLGVKMSKNNSIIVGLDGDDRLKNDEVLNKLDKIYQNNDIWMTYGSYENSDGTRGITGYYDKKTIDNNLFRKSDWYASHLRTYKRELFLSIDEKDFKDDNGNFYKMTGDLIMTFPMLEMSGNRIHHIEDILYVYNRDNELSDDKVDRELQYNIELKIRNKSPYKKLDKLDLPLNSINNFVDQIYYINLERRKDRLEHIKSEFDKHDIIATRFDAIDGLKLDTNNNKMKNGAIGALRSHRGVLKDAIDKKQNIICVFEDDIIFCDDFKERFDFYVKNVPKDWDIMYLGCHFHGCDEPTYINKSIFRVNGCFGCFSMILNNKNNLFERILKASNDENEPIDDCINYKILSDKNIKAYVLKPFFVKTLKTISDISDSKYSFSYDVVDKHFKNKFEEEFPKIESSNDNYLFKIENAQTRSNKDICEDFLRSSEPFIIIFNGLEIFDSTLSDKNNLIFNHNHFTLYGRYFPYSGMLIKRK